MDIQISKNAIKFSKIIYNKYKETNNKNFDNTYVDRKDLISNCEISDLLDELENNNLIKTSNDYSFVLQDKFIVFDVVN